MKNVNQVLKPYRSFLNRAERYFGEPSGLTKYKISVPTTHDIASIPSQKTILLGTEWLKLKDKSDAKRRLTHELLHTSQGYPHAEYMRKRGYYSHPSRDKLSWKVKKDIENGVKKFDAGKFGLPIIRRNPNDYFNNLFRKQNEQTKAAIRLLNTIGDSKAQIDLGNSESKAEAFARKKLLEHGAIERVYDRNGKIKRNTYRATPKSASYRALISDDITMDYPQLTAPSLERTPGGPGGLSEESLNHLMEQGVISPIEYNAYLGYLESGKARRDRNKEIIEDNGTAPYDFKEHKIGSLRDIRNNPDRYNIILYAIGSIVGIKILTKWFNYV